MRQTNQITKSGVGPFNDFISAVGIIVEIGWLELQFSQKDPDN